MEEADLSSIVWRAPEWINALGGLRPDNSNENLCGISICADKTVLEYFSQSPFFDKRSNNALLKMQSQFQNFGDVNEALRKMTGIEFVLASHDDARLFVIYKQQRDAIDAAKMLSVYFIANGNIYLAPNVYNIVTSRLLNINESLKSAMSCLDNVVEFNPAKGYTYGRPEQEASESIAEDLPSQAIDQIDRTEVLSMHKALHSTFQSM